MPLPLDMLMPLMLFAFVMSVTPGPNNVMLLASGVNFGFVRTIPHMLGIAIGVVVLLLAVGLGLGAALQAVPQIYLALKWISVAYLLWLAWKIASAPAVPPAPLNAEAPAATAESTARPLSFLGAALFQWVNPKAWTMALTSVGAYTVPANYLPSLVAMALVFGVICLPVTGVWTLFGIGLRRLLADPVKLRIFNAGMGVLLVASIAPMLGDLWPQLRALLTGGVAP